MDKEELEWAIEDAKDERDKAMAQAKDLTLVIREMTKQYKKLKK